MKYIFYISILFLLNIYIYRILSYTLIDEKRELIEIVENHKNNYYIPNEYIKYESHGLPYISSYFSSNNLRNNYEINDDIEEALNNEKILTCILQYYKYIEKKQRKYKDEFISFNNYYDYWYPNSYSWLCDKINYKIKNQMSN
jgi:hypothetical protein